MGTVTNKMKIVMVIFFLTITFLSQAWGGKKYLIKTGDEDDDDSFIKSLIKVKLDEDHDGKEILLKNLKGKDLKKYKDMTADEQDSAAAKVQELVEKEKTKRKDYHVHDWAWA